MMHAVDPDYRMHLQNRRIVGRRLRIAVILERYGRVMSPCASIRLHPFFESFKTRSHAEVRYLLPSEISRFSPDLVVWHRTSIPHVEDVDALRDMANLTGARLIYDIDDNLLDMQGHGEQASYHGVTEAVRASLRVADEVWCSTPNLLQRAGVETTAELVLMPNVLDPELWNLDAEVPHADWDPSAPLQLLYMGTKTHDADFELVHLVIEQLERRHPGLFQLSIVGVRSRDAIGSARAPWLRTLTPPSRVGASYPAFVHWFRQLRGFDVGLAPLVASRFNACKSPIKILDYAAIGLPTLASKVDAYTHSFTHGLDCLHVDNTPEAWASALIELLQAPKTLRALAAQASQAVVPAAFFGAVDARWDRIRNHGATA